MRDSAASTARIASPDRAPSGAPAARFYLPQLDILRFFAFLCVFAFHAPSDRAFANYGILGDMADAGSFGVDLFFALSAYLITQLLLKERTMSGRIDVASFYLRRILRIWPLYFSFLALAFAISRLPFTGAHPLLLWATSEMEPRYFLVLLLLFGNFGYAAWGLPNMIIAPLWSICVEEQFYLVWPLVVRSGSRQRLIAAAVAMLALSNSERLLFWIHGMAGESIWLATFTHLDSIAAGILLAALARSTTFDLQPPARVGLLLIGAATWLFAGHCHIHSPATGLAATMLAYPAIALGSAAFLAATVGWRSGETGSAIKRALIYLGKISYGLYVFQGLAINTSKVLMFRLWWSAPLYSTRPLFICLGQSLYVVLALSLAILLAACSYRWLEAPMLRLKQRYAHVASHPV